MGPELTDVGRRLKVEEIVESVLWPKRQVKPEFSAWQSPVERRPITAGL